MGESASSQPFLSVVVPAYNEETRLPQTLIEVTAYLKIQGYSWEIVVVDDGSLDRTAEVVEDFIREYPGVSLLRKEHRGKASAITSGLFAAKGEIVLFCDADLSVPIQELDKVLPLFNDGYDIVIGSREMPGARRYGEPYYRHIMGRVFNYLVTLLAVRGFRDTQCGFKALRASVAQSLFRLMKLYRADGVPIKGPMVTGFDVELLFLAKKQGYRTAEVPVQWYYAAGSKVDPLRDTFRMLGDILRVRMNDLSGKYNARG